MTESEKYKLLLEFVKSLQENIDIPLGHLIVLEKYLPHDNATAQQAAIEIKIRDILNDIGEL